MRIRVVVLGGLLLAGAALTTSTTVGQPTPAGKAAPDAATRLRELEARVAQLEKRLGAGVATPEEIPFGEVVVNLQEERMNRYLRVKIAVAADPASRQDVADGLTRKRAELKTWLIGYLADQSLADVAGGRNFNRLRAVVGEEFGRRLFPDRRPNPIREVLFEEYVVQ
jgi:flagellar protein FliL